MSFDLNQPDPAALAVLRDVVFADLPRDGGHLGAALEPNGGMRVLIISDRGTRGLGGPTRADEFASDGELTDFVDFMRNVGSPPDNELGGGTFGYGKAALYRCSASSTLLVYTRTSVGGRLEERLMGICVSKAYVVPDGEEAGRYTGRHWWGVQKNDVVEPLTGANAGEVAALIGFPPYDGDECGTSIAIVDFWPDDVETVDDEQTREADIEEIVSRLDDAVLWNFWPKMVPRADGVTPVEFSMRVNGNARRFRRPEDEPYLRAAVACLRAVRQPGEEPPTGVELHTIACRRPVQTLGHLALMRFAAPDGHSSAPGGAPAPGLPRPGRRSQRMLPTYHVALMRSAELVVRYHEGPKPQAEIMGWVGVFRTLAMPEVDRAFAKSEPPTHDAWIVDGMKDKRQKRLVNVGLRELSRRIDEYVTPQADQRLESEMAVGGIAAALGPILAGLPGLSPIVEAAAEPDRRRDGPRITPDRGEQRDLTLDGAASSSNDGGAQSGAGGPEGRTEGAADVEGTTDTGESAGAPVVMGRPKVKVASADLAVVDGHGVLRLTLNVTHGARSAATRITLQPTVVVAGGGRETEPPGGAPVPTARGWTDPSGVCHLDSGLERVVAASDDGDWVVDVDLVNDAEIRVSVRATPEAL